MFGSKNVSMRSSQGLIFALLLICGAGCAQRPTPIGFCSLAAGERPWNGGYVRVSAVGLFSDHGAYLTHPDCPSFHAEWDEANTFRSDPSWITLGDAIFQNRQSEVESHTLSANDLAVDISARVEWRSGRATLVVDRRYSVHPTPRVYRDEMDRDREYCELGSATGIEPQETRAACERLRASTQAND